MEQGFLYSALTEKNFCGPENLGLQEWGRSEYKFGFAKEIEIAIYFKCMFAIFNIGRQIFDSRCRTFVYDYFPASEAEKNFSLLTKLHSNIQTNVSINIFWNLYEHSIYLEKRIFK